MDAALFWTQPVWCNSNAFTPSLWIQRHQTSLHLININMTTPKVVIVLFKHKIVELLWNLGVHQPR